METPSLLVYLSVLTLVIVLGAAIWQWRRVRQSEAVRGEKPDG